MVDSPLIGFTPKRLYVGKHFFLFFFNFLCVLTGLGSETVVVCTVSLIVGSSLIGGWLIVGYGLVR